MSVTATLQSPPVATLPVATQTPDEKAVVIQWRNERLWASVVHEGKQYDFLLASPDPKDSVTVRIDVYGTVEKVTGR